MGLNSRSGGRLLRCERRLCGRRGLKELQESKLFWLIVGLVAANVTLGFAPEILQRHSFLVALEDDRVDIAAAADRRRVAQTLGDTLDRLDDVALGLPFIFRLAHLGQRERR